MHELKENLDIHYIKHPSIDGIENNFIFKIALITLKLMKTI